jgi:uncharacterized OB-fold protein
MTGTSLPGTTSIGRYMNTAEFWDATRDQRLLLQFCAQTQRWQAYPRPVSIYTGRRDLEWREASGDGSLTSWTVDRMIAPDAGAAPRIQALVDLAEGVRLLTWLVRSEVRDLHVGMPMRIAWIPMEDGLHWPAFEPL